MGWMYGFLCGAIVLTILRYGPGLWRDWRAFQAWRLQHDTLIPAVAMAAPVVTPVPAPEPPLTSYELPAYDPTILAGAGLALKNPPSNIAYIVKAKLHDPEPYWFPLGWSYGVTDVALNSAKFVGDVNHVALTGFTDSGKDSWAVQALLYLALMNTPDKLQLAIVDGKGGLSWLGWGDKAHTWLLAKRIDDIRPAMEKLKQERERRIEVLEAANCEKWEEYDKGDMPLLVVFVSELMLLQDATSKTELADWLNTELTSSRAAGIRYIVSGQTFTRMDTRWRSQISLYIAGYQPRGDADEPNTTFTTAELKKLGIRRDGAVIGVPPSELPVPPDGAGVFTCVQGRMVVTMRAPYYDKAHRQMVLSKLPDKPKKALHRDADQALHDSLLRNLIGLDTALPVAASSVLPIGDLLPAREAAALSLGKGMEADFGASEKRSKMADFEPHPLTVNGVALPVVALDEVPLDEQRRIVETAATVSSRGQLCQALYETRGGRKYTIVQIVCDAAGLLMPQAKAA